MYGKVTRARRQYRKRAGELREAPVGESASVKEEANGYLKVIDTGPPLATATEELESSFLQHLRSYGGGVVLGGPAHPGRYQVDAKSHVEGDADVSDRWLLHQASGTKRVRRGVNNTG